MTVPEDISFVEGCGDRKTAGAINRNPIEIDKIVYNFSHTKKSKSIIKTTGFEYIDTRPNIFMRGHPGVVLSY